MRVLLDACVLYPTVLREILLGVAARGVYTPLWSARILEEWARAAARTGDEPIARAEIARLRAAWPEAEVAPGPEEGLALPDPNDLHVLAAAIAGGAGELVTLNLRDFPTRELSRHGVVRRDPDGFLLEAYHADPAGVAGVVHRVAAEFERLSGREQPLRPLLKRARLPRLGKAISL